MLRKSTFILLLFFCGFLRTHGQIQFPLNSSFKYVKGKDAQSLSLNWMGESFDDASWAIDNAPFWYGDGANGTILADMQESYSTLYLRSTFEVQNLDRIENIVVTADYDDGFVIWINGEEAMSANAPAAREYNAFAPYNHESGIAETFLLSVDSLNLKEGTNVIAIQGFNISLTSSDFHLNVGMSATLVPLQVPETPDSIGITFDHDAGFYNNSFTAVLTHPDTGADIVYTLDGSNPQNSSTFFTGKSPVSVVIDPTSTVGRPKAPGVVLRASIVKDTLKPSKPETRTYLFPMEIAKQTSPGGGWPSENINGQQIDNDMDPDVVNNPDYKELITKSLKDIPTLSIVTDMANLFDPATGIYVNAEGQGEEWERECSFELLEHQGDSGFTINAGLRIRGGWSRHDYFPKHSFRLFFREDYGASKLNYPLFGDEGVDQFDKIDLRTAQNYSWSAKSDVGKYNTFLREVFTRDAQGESGNPYTRSRYYHLYLNGMYWGLFMTQERAEARFASDYFGDDKDNYDVIKVSGEEYSKDIEATDGNLEGWQKVWDLAQQGFENQKVYNLLQGKNENGEREPGLEVLVDIDNLIDYMINIFYTGNFDAPVSAFGSNKNANNFYAINNRNDPMEGFKFFVHDGEHALAIDAVGPGTGLYENRVDIGYRTDNTQMVVSSFNGFHPQWLHHLLTQNADYKQRFADRSYFQLTGDGIFTPDACLTRLEKRFEMIEYAIIAESARWGDAKMDEPRTKNDDWLPEVNNLRNDYFPYRTDIVIEQLKGYDMFTNIAPPEVLYNAANYQNDVVTISGTTSARWNNPDGKGDIYYCLNGDDPRLSGGALNPVAIKANTNDNISLNDNTQLKARILVGGEWSALTDVTFLYEQSDFSKLKITELHYHPLSNPNGGDTISGKSYEFIEFKNTDETKSLNLSGITVDSAIRYTFPEGTILLPQDFYVLASKPRRFYERYEMIPSGNFKKNLSNSGEKFQISDAGGDTIVSFTYSDLMPWPTEADGTGPSLVSAQVNPDGYPGNFAYWTRSWYDHGSPFEDDTISIIISPVEQSLANNPALELKVYPNPSSDIVFIKGDVSNVLGDTYINIFSLNGTLITKLPLLSSQQISLRSMQIPAGIYLLKVEGTYESEAVKIVYNP